MVGELASALPEDGGFYIWVSRALGRFWGFQEAWLSLSASIFDMAIYPALAVAYLGQLDPGLTAGHRGLALSLAVVVICVAWNLRGAYSVGQGSLWMLGLLLTPFLGIIGLGIWRSGLFHIAGSSVQHASLARTPHGSMVTALLFVVWNYMGWDNASTIAAEVEDPQRNYIRSMLAAVLLVAGSYVLPIAIVALTGVPSSMFVTGSWVEVARILGTHVWPPFRRVACHCCCNWRCTDRHRHVQRTHAFLRSRSCGHGQRWSAAESLGTPHGQWCSLGRGAGVWSRLGAGARIQSHASSRTRHTALWIEPGSGICCTRGFAMARTVTGPALPRSSRPLWRSGDWHHSYRGGFLYHLRGECRSHYSQVTGDSFRNFSRGCGSAILCVHISSKTRRQSYNFVMQWYTKMKCATTEIRQRKLRAVNANPAFDMPFHQPWCSFEKK